MAAPSFTAGAARRPYPAYLFGFAVGPFTRTGERAGGAELTYYGEGTSAAELRQLFRRDPGMVAFFADKAGLPLPAAAMRSCSSPAAKRRKRRPTR
jgi:aminopeptidase N